ncbi:unnamed protein product, partial [Brenthis ino]
MYKLLFVVTAAAFVGADPHHGNPHEPAVTLGPRPLRAIVRLASPDGRDVHGNVTFTQEDDKVRIQGRVYGMPPGEYGFHVHQTGDITGGCLSTGPHFNPDMKDHGHPEDENRHVGDLGNIEFDSDQLSNIDFTDNVIALEGPHNILGRAIVLHAMADDFGRTDHPDSKKTGNAGGRVACGVIGILSPVTGWERSEASNFASTSAVTCVLAAITFILQ